MTIISGRDIDRDAVFRNVGGERKVTVELSLDIVIDRVKLLGFFCCDLKEKMLRWRVMEWIPFTHQVNVSIPVP